LSPFPCLHQAITGNSGQSLLPQVLRFVGSRRDAAARRGSLQCSPHAGAGVPIRDEFSAPPHRKEKARRRSCFPPKAPKKQRSTHGPGAWWTTEVDYRSEAEAGPLKTVRLGVGAGDAILTHCCSQTVQVGRSRFAWRLSHKMSARRSGREGVAWSVEFVGRG
jgi:hypothetical protein